MGSLTVAVVGLLVSVLVDAAWAEPFVTIRDNGDPANRVDIVILGDGYTAAEIGKYGGDVDSLVNGLFAQEPFQEYQRYFNVHRVDVISNESGADHPERSVFKDTALHASYNCFGIQRLICVDSGEVFNVLQRSVAPDQRDVIVVVVNDAEYGGSGGLVAVTSLDPSVVELILHELGHSFGLLADEYNTSPPACFNGFEPPEPNVTRETNPNNVKWNVGGGPPTGWIEPTTPIPTFSTTPGIVGLYEGAKYCINDLYRPTFDSKMRSLDRPFEQVNTEQLVKRIYNWVSPIDSSDPVSSIIAPPAKGAQNFSVQTPSPLTGSLQVTWKVDGQAAGTGHQFRLGSVGSPTGAQIVEVMVEDPTPLVRDDPANVLIETRTWTLDSAPPDTIITSGPTGLLASNNATFSWSGSDNLTVPGNLEYAFRLDPLEPSFSTFGQLTTTTYSNLANGNYVFLVKTRDQAGNEDLSPASRAFDIEILGLGPDTIISSSPPVLSRSPSSRFVFMGTELDSKFSCSLDGSPFSACKSPKKYPRLRDGSYVFQVRAIDSNDTVDPTPANHSWTIDTTRPDTTITANPPAATNLPHATFHFASSETGGTFQCKLDAGAFVPCTSPQMYSALPSGKHTFQVAAIDGAGNIDKKAALYKWTIDTTPPETKIMSKPPATTKSTSAKFSFSANERGSTFQCSLDGAPFGSCLRAQVFPGPLASGNHTLQVRAADPAGNTDLTPASYTWTVQ
jgi:hypothetical protein